MILSAYNHRFTYYLFFFLSFTCVSAQQSETLLLFPIEQHSKWGYMDRFGRTVIIDQTGQMAIEPQFYYAKDFRQGLARVWFTRDDWGYINKTGRFVWQEGPPAMPDEEANTFIQAGHTRDLHFVGWSPDGNLLVSESGADGWIRIWNPANGKLIWEVRGRSLKPDVPLKSPDGNLLASGSKDTSYVITDARSGNVIWNIKGTSAERVTSPDGLMIAERGRYGDACVKLFEAKTNRLIRRLEGHPGIVYSIAFSPDGKTIASGSSDRTIKFWERQTGALRKSLAGHTGAITSVAFSADAKTLVSGSNDDTLKIWNASDGRLLRTIPAFTPGVDGITSVAFSPDGRTIIAGSETRIRIWETETGRHVATLETHESHTGSGPHGTQVEWCCGSEVNSVAFSPGGALIVSAHKDGTIKLWDARKAKLVRTIKSRFPDARRAVFSPDGSLIASGYDESNSRVELWSVRSGKLALTLGEDSDYTHSLSFSSDGKMIVTGHMSDDVKVWNAKTGKLIGRFKQPFVGNYQVAFSPDGRYVVSGGENQNIMLWDLRTRELIWSILPAR